MISLEDTRNTQDLISTLLCYLEQGFLMHILNLHKGCMAPLTNGAPDGPLDHIIVNTMGLP